MEKNSVVQVLSYVLVLLVGLGIGYAIWHESPTTGPNTASTTTTATAGSVPAPGDVQNPKGGGKVTDTAGETDPKPATTTPAEPEATTPEPTKPAPVTSTTGTPTLATPTNCGGSDFDLKKYLNNFAAAIERDSIYYNTEDLSDCSGIFLRVMKGLEGTCPDYIYPNIKEHRDTRLLGKWFYDNNNLVLVKDILKHQHLIKPGAVLFYGRRDSVYNDLTLEKLISRAGIEHVGIVTDITKENDVVTKYALFHGRTWNKIASRTYYHKRVDQEKNGKYYPHYGNGRQRIIAIGFVNTVDPGV